MVATLFDAVAGREREGRVGEADGAAGGGADRTGLDGFRGQASGAASEVEHRRGGTRGGRVGAWWSVVEGRGSVGRWRRRGVGRGSVEGGGAVVSDPERVIGADLLRDEAFRRVAETAEMLTRSHVIDAIQGLNPSVGASYLNGFDDIALVSYLERLLRAGEPRGECSRWTRLAGSPAICVAEAE